MTMRLFLLFPFLLLWTSAQTPQKLRTFYALDDSTAPDSLRQNLTAITASDHVRWTAAPFGGLLRIDSSAPPRDRRQYFAGLRYLPDDAVLALAPDRDGGVWVRTRTGIAHIELRRMTLAEKAEYFEQRIRARHSRYGMVADSSLTTPGRLESNRLTPNDNDGLWSAMYAAAECFRYAATKSPEALANARRTLEALLFLEQVTGHAGFPARSYIRKGDWRPIDGTWHWTAKGDYEWKADTSSDEIVGHFLAFSIAFDLLPDADLKTRISATTRRIMDHIIEHGYTLTDVNGKPTTWGLWNREYFESRRGRADSPLNAVEILSFLKSAEHITGDAKYAAESRKLTRDLGYATQTTRLLELRHEINYSDEELAMLSFYPLFRYERDPALLATYRAALELWWQNIRREQNPLWIYIYKTANPDVSIDLEPAQWTLNRIPMDLIAWTVKNSHRPDIVLDGGPDRFRHPQTNTLLPPDERPVSKWNGNPFVIDGGNGGRSEDDGAFFLLPYWLGRYHNLHGL
jgi:hypothetical protein